MINFKNLKKWRLGFLKLYCVSDMDALAIIKAYGMLKSHGLVNTIVGFEGIDLNKESDEILGNYVAAQIGKKPTSHSIPHETNNSSKVSTT